MRRIAGSRRYLILCFWLVCLLLTAGCSHGTDTQDADGDAVVEKTVVDTAYKVYYLNTEGTALEAESVIFTAQTAEELITECLEYLYAEPEDTQTMTSALTEDIVVENTVYDSVLKQVDLYFNSAYAEIEKNREILVRAAVVKTMGQFDGVIDYVQFFVDGEALTETDGTMMIMMADDFVDSTKSDIAGLNEETIRLYFASSDGTALVAEDVYVHYSSAYSLEQVIVESLIAGPISDNLNATLSSDVKLYDNISVTDGVCHVDFNQRFLDRVNDQSFALNVYSVVNSLTELDYIDQVQIKIDGEIVEGNDETISLAEPLSRNEELILTSTDTLSVREESEESKESEEVQTQETDSQASQIQSDTGAAGQDDTDDAVTDVGSETDTSGEDGADLKQADAGEIASEGDSSGN